MSQRIAADLLAYLAARRRLRYVSFPVDRFDGPAGETERAGRVLLVGTALDAEERPVADHRDVDVDGVLRALGRGFGVDRLRKLYRSLGATQREQLSRQV